MNDAHRVGLALVSRSDKVVALLRDKLPIIVGKMAKSHYQENFRLGGFRNNGFKEWPRPKRYNADGKTAGEQYGTLLSSRRHLYSSFKYTGGAFRVRVYNPVPYASAHNDGETITVPVTDKMRKMGWARYYAAGGKDASSPDAEFWKRFALTRKTQLRITMPKRPILKESAELNTSLVARADKEIHKIVKI
jgi:hypothetical protein